MISAVLWLYERDSALPYEAMVIFAVVLLNAILGYVQEARAESAIAALRQISAAHAKVIRDGKQESIVAMEVVPGDLLLIEEGEGVITGQMWFGIIFVGVVFAGGTLLVIDWSLPGGLIPGSGSLRYAQTMAFTTMVFFSIFTVFNARSDDRSAFADLWS